MWQIDSCFCCEILLAQGTMPQASGMHRPCTVQVATDQWHAQAVHSAGGHRPVACTGCAQCNILMSMTCAPSESSTLLFVCNWLAQTFMDIARLPIWSNTVHTSKCDLFVRGLPACQLMSVWRCLAAVTVVTSWIRWPETWLCHRWSECHTFCQLCRTHSNNRLICASRVGVWTPSEVERWYEHLPYSVSNWRVSNCSCRTGVGYSLSLAASAVRWGGGLEVAATVTWCGCNKFSFCYWIWMSTEQGTGHISCWGGHNIQLPKTASAWSSNAESQSVKRHSILVSVGKREFVSVLLLQHLVLQRYPQNQKSSTKSKMFLKIRGKGLKLSDTVL